jgi:hypothetical protein
VKIVPPGVSRCDAGVSDTLDTDTTRFQISSVDGARITDLAVNERET